MYTFVFLWTPALNPHTYIPTTPDAPGPAGAAARALASAGAGGSAEPHLPHGFVFAIFMTASMVGTALAGRLMATLRLEAVLQVGGRRGVGGGSGACVGGRGCKGLAGPAIAAGAVWRAPQPCP